jgi:hypothetical protein
MKQLCLFALNENTRPPNPEEENNRHHPTTLEMLRKNIEQKTPKSIIESIGFEDTEDGRTIIVVELSDIKYEVPTQWNQYAVITRYASPYRNCWWYEK